MTNRTVPVGPLIRLWRWIKAWRAELGVALALVIARSMAGHVVGLGWADFGMVTAVALGVGTVQNSGPLVGLLVQARRRRRWEYTFAAVCTPLSPRIIRLGTDRRSEWAAVRIAAGGTVAELTRRADALAACLGVTAVRVKGEPSHAGLAVVRALRRDPLEGPGLPSPLLVPSQTSLWQPVPVGIKEDGGVVTMTLFEHNLLVGGEPGAGKSVAVAQLVAAAALDPTSHLWLLDGKVVELATWRRCAQAFAGTDITEAISVLRRVQEVMDARYRQLIDDSRRKVATGTGLHLVVVDELALYSTWPERKARDAFSDVLRDLVARGRAAGVIVVVATQKPSSEVVPTSLRDLFGFRWALRCTTNAASDTILGSGWAANGITAAAINPTTRGIGWLLHESGQPIRLRAFHLDDADVDTIAARAVALRQDGDDGR